MNKVANSKNLDIYCIKYVIYQLQYIHITNYCIDMIYHRHILCDHYEDYFELAGATLHKVSIEVTESVHPWYWMFKKNMDTHVIGNYIEIT